MLEAVIFDMDGLLIDSEPLWHRAEKKIFAQLGIELTTRMCLQTTGIRIDEVVRHWYRRQPWEGRDLDEVAEGIIAEVHRLAICEGLPLAGVKEALNLCAGQGYKLALASSSPRAMIEAVVDKLEIREHFSVLCSAEHESHGKPHPAVYLNTARQLGVVPNHCLAFEDSFAGVIAAKAASMKVVAVPSPAQFDESRFHAADLKLPALTHFKPEHLEWLAAL